MSYLKDERMRSLILGGGGCIGSSLVTACDNRRFPYLSTYYQHSSSYSEALDVRDADAVRQLVLDYQPEVVFYSAPVDLDLGVEWTLAAIADLDCRCVIFTGDHLFGHCRLAMREDDPVTPGCPTGKRMTQVEELTRKYLPRKHLIVRTSMVYGSMRRNDPYKQSLKRMDRRKPFHADDETVRMPTFAEDLAEATLDLLHHGQRGTFHVVGPDRHTEYSFSRMIAHLHQHDADLIQTDYANTRQRNHWLDRFKVRQLLGANVVRPLGEGLRKLRDAERETTLQVA